MAQISGAHELLTEELLSCAGSRLGLDRRVGVLSLHGTATCLLDKSCRR